jgi:hypothetical protein
MRVSSDPRLPILGDPSYESKLNYQLYEILREIAFQLNALSEGYVYAATNAATSAPTTGSFNVGDFIRNSTPTELGSASSKYIVTGWYCVTAGEPGTWVESRALTGN